MAIEPRPIDLVRFSWNLKEVPEGGTTLPKPYVLRAVGEQEADEAVAVVQSCYNLDPEWSGCAQHTQGTVIPGVTKALAKEPTALFVLHGNRIIAVSVYDATPPDGGVNLVSGPCVLGEYRSRGFGGALLAATLGALRAEGLTEATGITRLNSASAKFLYSKFGGRPIPAKLPASIPAEANAA